MDFTVPESDIVQIKESKKLDKYPELNRKLKKSYNRKVTVIPVIVGTLRTVLKDLEKKQAELKSYVIY